MGHAFARSAMPTSHASKRVQGGQYVFEVHMSALLPGKLLPYEGSLDLVDAAYLIAAHSVNTWTISNFYPAMRLLDVSKNFTTTLTEMYYQLYTFKA
jgi:hypothetical protein